jgi:hypothetical protein
MEVDENDKYSVTGDYNALLAFMAGQKSCIGSIQKALTKR